MPQILIGELGRPPGMALAWFLDSKFSGSNLKAKISGYNCLRGSASSAALGFLASA